MGVGGLEDKNAIKGTVKVHFWLFLVSGDDTKWGEQHACLSVYVFVPHWGVMSFAFTAASLASTVQTKVEPQSWQGLFLLHLLQNVSFS